MKPALDTDTARALGVLKSRLGDIKLRALRDLFAAAAVHAIANSARYAAADESRIARDAYALADALIAARGGKDS